MITSVQNPKIKQLVKLRDSRTRRQEKSVLIEGARECMCALKAKLAIREVFLCEAGLNDEGHAIIAELTKAGLSPLAVNERVFEKISFGHRNEGIIVIADEPTHTLPSLTLRKAPLILITDAIEKPGNLGAIIRTANAAGSDAIISTNARLDIYNHNVIRASLGAVFNTPVLTTTAEATLAWLEQKKIQTIIAHPDAPRSYLSFDYRKPTAFILGREDTGVSTWWRDHATHQAVIPMHGVVNSLNVSVTAAVLIYEALRQRQ